MSRRNFKLTCTPRVETGSAYRRYVKLDLGGWAGKQQIRCTQELDLDEAAGFIKQIRIAMKTTCKNIVEHAEQCAEDAESPI